MHYFFSNYNKIFGIFSPSNVIQFETIPLAVAANPMFILVPQKNIGEKVWAGTNIQVQLNIFSNSGNKQGLRVGKWRTAASWNSDYAFTPCSIKVEFIDPHGIVQEHRFTPRAFTVEDVAKEVVEFIQEVSTCDSWSSFDIFRENKQLKKKVEELKKKVNNLEEKLVTKH
ncbi:hypothetical protein [Solirubrum puertoriconensis]|uniref:Uncharacterized protein n=1 Tax=Solirubrum puertoriconensis TaxID=1751427 RepID=A0A9X0HIC1_SOLP1|nr:hypothetical protein [Solirubrum puertoriconensis]KUG06372.1 hypothetical protein ASU33_03170 [Solirubrum puertoriconensis]